MDHGVKVASVLANSFSRRCSYIAESDAHVKEKAIQFGFVLGKRGEGGVLAHNAQSHNRTREDRRYTSFSQVFFFFPCSF